MNTLETIIQNTSASAEELAKAETYIPALLSLLKSDEHKAEAMTAIALAQFRPDLFNSMINNTKLDMITKATQTNH